MNAVDRLSAKFFHLVHNSNLVYNACWEDPQLDRQALQLGADDEVLVITSAGCNALDYLLDAPRHVYAVDLNFRQNALLDLKIAGIRRLDHETFFALFGEGRLPHARRVYWGRLRAELPSATRDFWDRHIDSFSGQSRRRSFYFHGTSGSFAWLVNIYIDRVARLRGNVEAVLNSQSIHEQREHYAALKDRLWKGYVHWLLRRDATLAMLGVPRPQRLQIDRDYQGGVARFVEDCVETVFARMPIHDNYFWRLYLTGRYSRDCCPEYLKPHQFARLKAGLVDRLSTHSTSVCDFVQGTSARLTKLVLLDHMDWLSHAALPLLQRQWQVILDRTAAGARVLWRSAGMQCDHIDALFVRSGKELVRLGEVLNYDRPLAAELHARDRVHTYGSFYIADLAA